MDERNLEKVFLVAGKTAAKKLAKKFWVLILPYLPVILFGFFIFFMICWLIAAVYSAFPIVTKDKKNPILAGVYESEQDKELHDKYVKLANQYNVVDTWIVSGESSVNKPHYPGKGTYLGALNDRYNHDEELKLQWGNIHAACLYKAYSLNLTEISKDLPEDSARKLHPYFYYKESEIITTTTNEDGESETTRRLVYLLVEAYTIQGHYQYHYKWVTETRGNTTITYEQLEDTLQILPNKWQRLENFILQEYKINQDSNDLALAREGVWEAGIAFNEYKEWLAWLKENDLMGKYLSQSMIPSELIPFFKEAEEKYGIPWWFLAAIAYKESSFNPKAENPETKCFGLMQVSPSNWQVYAARLGFDPELHKENPRAQILVGAYMLRELGFKNVDWQGDWKEQSLPILIHYGGFVEVPSNLKNKYSSVEEWCRAVYASKIWDYAEQFKKETLWPVPGYTAIRSPFDLNRLHPTKKVVLPHYGIDIAAPMGATVISVSAGEVTRAGWENPNNHKQGYGLYVTIRDENYLYKYAHLSQINVKLHQKIQVGDIVGKVGSTGDSTGPHLHFEVRDLSQGGPSGLPIDPLLKLYGN
ncbi:M23 family metallopeptidase [Desulforamulus ruminis]|uniref:M23 family metallopeptidase n=1 Tax=Desulforamulus ruminis TaxID=1564 RepID=UPI00235274FC|nr:peptidoglycan DD-metalloendopeptidase family protein [Desulforamulus ruminis]